MRRRTLALLPAFGIALAIAAPAHAGHYLRLEGVAGERKGAASPDCAVADAKHKSWVDLLSVGSGVKQRAMDGGPGRITIEVRDDGSVRAIKAMMKCGGKLDLTLRNDRRKYRLSGVAIATGAGDRPQRSKMTEIDTFTLTYSAIRREN